MEEQSSAENRKVNAFKQCYLQHCIEQNAFPHQAIMKRIRMAEEDSKMLENFELDGSGIKEEDLYPLIQAIQVTGSVKTVNTMSAARQDLTQLLSALKSVPNSNASSATLPKKSEENSRDEYETNTMATSVSMKSLDSRKTSTASVQSTSQSFRPTQPKGEPPKSCLSMKRKYSNVDVNPRKSIVSTNSPQVFREQSQSSIKVLKSTLEEGLFQSPPPRIKINRVMSRLEWITQLTTIFDSLAARFKKESFKKEIIAEMIRGSEASFPLLSEEEYNDTHLDKGHSVQEMLKVLNESGGEVFNYDDVIELVATMSRKEAAADNSMKVPKAIVKMPQLDLTRLPLQPQMRTENTTLEDNESKPETKTSARTRAAAESISSQENTALSSAKAQSNRIDNQTSGNTDRPSKNEVVLRATCVFVDDNAMKQSTSTSRINSIENPASGPRNDTARFLTNQTQSSGRQAGPQQISEESVAVTPGRMRDDSTAENGGSITIRKSPKTGSPVQELQRSPTMKRYPKVDSPEMSASQKKIRFQEDREDQERVQGQDNAIHQAKTSRSASLKETPSDQVLKERGANIQNTIALNNSETKILSEKTPHFAAHEKENGSAPESFRTLSVRSFGFSEVNQSSFANQQAIECFSNITTVRKNENEVKEAQESENKHSKAQHKREEEVFVQKQNSEAEVNWEQQASLSRSPSQRIVHEIREEEEYIISSDNDTPQEVIEDEHHLQDYEEVPQYQIQQLAQSRQDRLRAFLQQRGSAGTSSLQENLSLEYSKDSITTKQNTEDNTYQNGPEETQPIENSKKSKLRSNTKSVNSFPSEEHYPTPAKAQITKHPISETPKSYYRSKSIAVPGAEVVGENPPSRSQQEREMLFKTPSFLQNSSQEKLCTNSSISFSKSFTMTPFSAKNSISQIDIQPTTAEISFRNSSNNTQITTRKTWAKKAPQRNDFEFKLLKLEQITRYEDNLALVTQIRNSYASVGIKGQASCAAISLSHFDEAHYIDAIEKKFIGDLLEEIQVFKLADSMISEVSLNLMMHQNILVLNLSNNGLSSSAFLSKLPNLTFVNVSNNELEALDSISHCVKLEEIVFSHNKISRVPNLLRMKNLSLIDAAFNLIHSYENVALLSQSRKLKVINLTQNPIANKFNYKGVLKKLLPQVLAFDISITELSDYKHIGEYCFHSLQYGSEEFSFQKERRCYTTTPDPNIITQDRDHLTDRLDKAAPVEVDFNRMQPNSTKRGSKATLKDIEAVEPKKMMTSPSSTSYAKKKEVNFKTEVQSQKKITQSSSQKENVKVMKTTLSSKKIGKPQKWM